MKTLEHFYMNVETALGRFITKIVDFAPVILGALLILLIGYLIAKIIGWMVRKIAARLGVDRAFARAGLQESMRQANIRVGPSGVLGRLSFWLVMLTFILAAFDSLGITAVVEAFSQLVAYIPNLFVGVLMIVLGLFLAQATRSAVSVSLHRMAIDYAAQISSVSYYAVALVTLMMAARQLRIDISAFESLVYLLVGAVVFYGGALMVWGSHLTVENIVAGYYLRKVLKPGSLVHVKDADGIVDLIQNTHVLLRSGAKTILIPNSVLFKEISSMQAET
ncbi:MAG: hypothetical protein RIF32_07810 [Leptospirales bacterium]|jgi:hypothetical protein